MRKNNTVLYGLPCTGKSFSIATIFKIKEFLEGPGRLIFIVTERNCLRGLEAGLKHYKISVPENKLFLSIISREKKERLFAKEKAAFESFALKTASEAQKDDAKSNMNRDKYDYFTRVIGGMDEIIAYDFKTNATKKIGNIGYDTTDNDVIVIDGLTPITQGIWAQIKGDRVITDIKDYQTVQFAVRMLCETWQRVPASVILLAHADKAIDEVSNTTLTRVSLDAGVKITTSFGGYWDNIIYAYRDNANNFYWAGQMRDIETAPRDIPALPKVIPDFSHEKNNFFGEISKI